MGNLGKIVYLSEAQKDTLFSNGSVTSGNTTITYSANDLYITPDKSIDTITLNGTNHSAVSGVVNLGHVLTSTDNSIIAPVETSSTASQLYNVGDLFVYNDQLYVATASIPTSTNITPNTNCSLTSVAEKLNDLKLDVQINGTSIVSNGVANIPIATGSVLGVSRPSSSSGISINENGYLVINCANADQRKAGTDVYRPIVPACQHDSAFYGLAKAAGADMASVSGTTVGVYPEAQKIAIQKMLGIYEAPWELIREDTVTNATEADIEITVDGNGQAFELTDVYIEFISPKQDTVFTKGDGYCDIYYSQNYFVRLSFGAYTQQANATARASFVLIEQRNGINIREVIQNTESGNLGTPIRARANQSDGYGFAEIANRIYTKIIISKVTGKAQYRIYGRRKWWT